MAFQTDDAARPRRRLVKPFLTLGIAASTMGLSTIQTGGSSSTSIRRCPDISKAIGICAMVSSRIKDTLPNSQFEYRYERAVYEAACVDPNVDDEQKIVRNVNSFFVNARPQLQCQGADFDVVEGNIFKYAISSRAFGFINQSIDEWHVDLNWIDKDQTTLLDYVENQVSRARGTHNEEQLRNYYNKLKKNGAKHGSELR